MAAMREYKMVLLGAGGVGTNTTVFLFSLTLY